MLEPKPIKVQDSLNFYHAKIMCATKLKASFGEQTQYFCSSDGNKVIKANNDWLQSSATPLARKDLNSQE